MSGLRLRAAREADRDAMIAFWIEAWTPVFPQIDFVARASSFRAILDAAVARGAALTVAEDATGLVGFSLCEAVTQDAATQESATRNVPAREMDQICVAPRAQGSGVAKALLDAVKRDAARVTLKVNRLNARALRFYEREGFRVKGEGINPTSGLPILHMEWRAAQVTPRNPASPG